MPRTNGSAGSRASSATMSTSTTNGDVRNHEPPFWHVHSDGDDDDDDARVLEAAQARARQCFFRLFVWMSLGQMALGFALTAFGFHEYVARKATRENRPFLSVGVGLMFVGLVSFIVCLAVVKLSKPDAGRRRRRMRRRGSRDGGPRGRHGRPRFIPIQMSEVFALREAPPRYSLPGTSFLPVENQPPPTYDDALRDGDASEASATGAPALLVLDGGVGVGGGLWRDAPAPAPPPPPPPGYRRDDRHHRQAAHVNRGFTMDEIAAEEVAAVVAAADVHGTTRRGGQEADPWRLLPVASVGIQTDGFLFDGGGGGGNEAAGAQDAASQHM